MTGWFNSSELKVLMALEVGGRWMEVSLEVAKAGLGYSQNGGNSTDFGWKRGVDAAAFD